MIGLVDPLLSPSSCFSSHYFTKRLVMSWMVEIWVLLDYWSMIEPGKKGACWGPLLQNGKTNRQVTDYSLSLQLAVTSILLLSRSSKYLI
jgi:hypothetical protein